ERGPVLTPARARLDAELVRRGMARSREQAGELVAAGLVSVAGQRAGAGAAHVVAADVGYGQLAWSLRTDPRVTVMDRVNVRTLDLGDGMTVPELVVADLSFISLTLVLPALIACATPDADFVLLVKPQFEVGKSRVGAGGVVRDSTDRSASVARVAAAAGQLGLGVRGITASPLRGPAENVEYFVWWRRGAPPLDEGQLQRAIEEGPS